MKQIFKGEVVRGHQVASGQAEDSPYPLGTLAMQRSYFSELGLDMASFHLATINVDISPKTFDFSKPDFHFENLTWTQIVPPETFSFFHCVLEHKHKLYSGYIYYPHPETKVSHFQKDGLLELLMPFVDELKYGDEVSVFIG